MIKWGIILLVLVVSIMAKDTKVDIVFSKGKTSVVYKEKIRGYDGVRYVFDVKIGQTIDIAFNPTNKSAYFNLLLPGEESALAREVGDRFTGIATKNGTYTVVVYLVRAAARRNENANFTLMIDVAGAGDVIDTHKGPVRYDASGPVKCSFGTSTLHQECLFKVIRYRKADAADIWIGRPNGEIRYLHYQKGILNVLGNSWVDWNRKEDQWTIKVDDKEFYSFPDALIYGG